MRLFFLILSLAIPASAEPMVMTVDGAVARALDQHPEIREARQNRAAAVADANAALTNRFPTVSATMQSTHAGRRPKFVLAGQSFTVTPEDAIDVTGRVEETLFTGGALTASIKRSDLLSQAARHSLRAAELAVTARTREACCEVLRARALHDATEASVKAALEHKKAAEARVRAGLVAGIEVVRAEVRVKQAALDEISTRNRERLAIANLANLMGLPAATAIDLQGELMTSFREIEVAESESSVLGARPDVQALRSTKDAEARLVDAARGAYFPSFEAFGEMSYQDDELKPSDHTWKVGIQGSWEIFNWWRTTRQVEAAKARSDAASQRVRKVEDRARIEIEEHQLSAKTALESIKLGEASVQSAEEDLRISKIRFNEGVGTGTEVLDAERGLAQARASLINAQADYAVAQIRLWLATGGDAK